MPTAGSSLARSCAAIAAALSLAGCASPDTAMVSGDTATVSVLGSESEDRERIFEATLAQAAKVAREHGYQYFTIIKSGDRSVTGVKQVPGETIPYANTARATTRPLGPTNLGTQNTPGYTYTTPGRTVPYTRPGLEITVKMYRQGEIDARMQGVWNIDFIGN